MVVVVVVVVVVYMVRSWQRTYPEAAWPCSDQPRKWGAQL